MRTERSAYEVLRIVSSATQRDVHLAYRHLARRYHPDGTAPDIGRMVEINAAYEELKSPDRRSLYDRRTREPVPVGPGRPGDEGQRGQSLSGLGPLGRRVAAAQQPAPTIDFGPYAGLRVTEVAALDPEYLRSLSRRAISSRLRDAIGRCLSDHTPSSPHPAVAR